MEQFVLDWAALPGDTLKERFEGIYVFLVGEVFPKVGERAFVLTSPEFASIFETACTRCFSNFNEDTARLESGDPVDCGQQVIRFRVLKSTNIPSDMVYVFGKTDVGVVRVLNFEI